MMKKAYVEEALLRFNYFPFQKEAIEELPAIFTTRQLVPEVAAKLTKGKQRKEGYDQVDYLLTRHTNVSRAISIPHPRAYCHLVKSIVDSWDEFSYVLENKVSQIKPDHHDYGRIILMDYENKYDKTDRVLAQSFGKKFRVHTDITNCFPSIYSHAIPWALVGLNEAKKSKNDKDKWFNQIDYCQRMLKRGETNGLPIGPATSNILSEAILARVDEKLRQQFTYDRYIDDYTCYCDTYEETQAFLRALREELKHYHFVLNLKKTTIDELPAPIDPEWLLDISTRMPSAPLNSKGRKEYMPFDVIRFFDYALSVSQNHPEGSVLKFAVKSIIRNIDEYTSGVLLQYLLNLVSSYPLLLPSLNQLFNASSLDISYPEQMNKICVENALQGRSDGMVWSLYYLNKYKNRISDSTAEAVMATKDCMAILSLYLSGQFDQKIEDFADDLIKQGDNYLLDQYWLLLYQLYFDGKIPNPCKDDSTFEILKKEDVSFVDRKDHFSRAEAKFETQKHGFTDLSNEVESSD